MMKQDICRVCLGTHFLRDIFEQCESETISSMIMRICKVQVYPNDGLPRLICCKCVSKLEECYKFKVLCEESDSKLRSLSNCLYDTSDDHRTVEDGTTQIDFVECNMSKKTGLDLESKTMQGVQKDILRDTVQESFREDNESKEIYNKTSKKFQKQQCFTCGKIMSSRFRLNTHLKTHTGEKPYSCSHCDKTFSLEQSLKVHLRVHSGEKPLQCRMCGKSFAHSSGLVVHFRKHTGELPFQCSMCPRKFRTNGHLKYHVSQHTGEKNFECVTCGRAFITRSDLKQHSQTHTNDKPYVCNVCGFRLTRAWHLKRHMFLHHGQKPYACANCQTKFLHKKDFDKHMETHCDKKDSANLESKEVI